MSRSRRRPIELLAPALAALALTAAGCGDSDDTTGGSSDGGEATTRADFIAAADEICSSTAADINAEISARFPDGQAQEEELAEVVTEVTLPALESQYEQIGALPVPEGDEEAVDEFLAAADEAIAETEENPEVLLTLRGAETPFDRTNELQQEFGLKVCGAPEP
jgi:hypothetical protein